WLVCLSFQPTLIGSEALLTKLDDLNVFAEVRQFDERDSEGVYSLMNKCYDKAKGSSSELARGLGYTNSVESVFLSYDEGNAKMKIGTNYAFVSQDRMREYFGER
ncbi:MAG: hypothetical protein WCI72_04065, partial [archaeon]